MAKANPRMTNSISKAVAAFRKWMTGVASAALVSLAIEINPVPASRPRVSRWGTYYTKTYAKWRKLAEPFAAAFKGEKFDGPVIVLIDTAVERPKTSERSYPRGDVDNFAKGPLDVITKAEKLWHDDDQVVGLAVFKRFTEKGETPGSYLTVVPLEE